MEKEIKQLIDDTFEKLSCPADGVGMYAEIQNAILTAFNIGKQQDEVEEPSQECNNHHQ